MYLKALHVLTRTPFTFTDEELQEMKQSTRTLEAVIKELEEEDA